MPVENYNRATTYRPHTAEFDRIYAFYSELERQERKPRLLGLVAVISGLVIAAMTVWLAGHPVDWSHLLTRF